jgi:hypothetical protein
LVFELTDSWENGMLMPFVVFPAKAGIQISQMLLDPGSSWSLSSGRAVISDRPPRLDKTRTVLVA